MGTIEALNDAARKLGLRFLVIGGHAVNATGYSRVTLDLDLLVSSEDRAAWATLLASFGYSVFHEGETFVQLTAPPGRGAWPVDLMFVGRESFEAMARAARSFELEGARLAIPAVLHLLALKIHSLRTGGFERHGKDFLDIVGLVRGAELDPRSEEIRALFERHGTKEWHEMVIEACSAPRA